MANLAWPAENAKLLQVNAPGAEDDYADVAAAGAQVWAGSIGAVLKRDRIADTNRDRGGETAAVVETIEADVLVIRKPPAAIANLTPGDPQSAHTVLVEDRRTAAPYVKTRWHVVGAENRARGKESDSLRLVLSDPRVEP
jgi:hypothetical protein